MMNEQEYLIRLEELLNDLPLQEKEDALRFVTEILEDAKENGQADPEIILGSPEEYAAGIREGLKDSIPPEIPVTAQANQPCPAKKKTQTGPPVSSFIKAVLILLSPVWILLLFAGAMMIFAIVLLAFMLLLMALVIYAAWIVTFVAMIWKGIVLTGSDGLGAIFDFGAALFSFSMIYFGFFIMKALLTRVIPSFCRWIKRILKVCAEKISRLFSSVIHNGSCAGEYSL